MTKLGDAIRAALDAHNWTQADLSDILGRPMQHINAIVNGGRGLTAQSAVELSQAFGNDPMDWKRLDIQDRLAKTAPPDTEGIARRRAEVEARRVPRIPIADAAREIGELAVRLQQAASTDDADAAIEALRKKVLALPRRRYQREYHRAWRAQRKQVS